MNKRELEDRLVNFGVAIIELSNRFNTSRAAAHFKNQIIGSGTAPALNYAEAMLRETNVALKIVHKAQICKDAKQLETDLKECEELIAIFIASIKTTKKRL